MIAAFLGVVERAVADGLAAVALVDRHGTTICYAGAISEDEAPPLAALVMYRRQAPGFAERLFAGEVVTLDLDEREVALGIARRQLFVLAVLGEGTIERVRELREDVANIVGGEVSDGPSELELIELGITVPRAKA